jgi:hypothetical protein
MLMKWHVDEMAGVGKTTYIVSAHFRVFSACFFIIAILF